MDEGCALRSIDSSVEVDEVRALRSIEEVYCDFKKRRSGLIKALTIDAGFFFELCHPDKEELSLYGLPNESWEVDLSFREVPSKLPKPACGINLARDWMGGWKERRTWLLMVAVHSDSWLIAVAFHFAALIGLGKSDRDKLFDMINELPTLFEVVALEYGSESPVFTYHRSIKGEFEIADEEIARETLVCGRCGGGDDKELTEKWILCDVCDLWFHLRCVNLRPAKAVHLARYKCPGCLDASAPAPAHSKETS